MTGLICLNKPAGISSFGAVAKVRGITREKKCGHTGTLDPMASGVLPVLLGGATRFLDYLPDSDKAYRAGFQLGAVTDTLDSTGRVLQTRPFSDVSFQALQQAVHAFQGEIEQVPPMYSACHVDGRRLYELARAGKEVERPPRRVVIHKIELLSYDAQNGTGALDVLCSKGTYVRTLIDDIGRRLGCGAMMTALMRTAAMGFSLENCVSLESLQQLRDTEQGFAQVLIPVDRALSAYPAVQVSCAQSRRFSNGGALDRTRVRADRTDGLCRVYSDSGDFLGLGQWTQEALVVKRILVKRD